MRLPPIAWGVGDANHVLDSLRFNLRPINNQTQNSRCPLRACFNRKTVKNQLSRFECLAVSPKGASF